MSRKLIWTYALILLAGFTATLFVVNPGLAVTPMGFSIAFLGMFGAAFFLDWLLSKVMPAHRLVMVPASLIGMMMAFTSMGAPGWAGLAMILVGIGYFTNARGDRRRRAAAAPPVDGRITA